METDNKKDIQRRITAPLFPALVALLLHKSYYWMVPYWVVLLFFYAVKSYILTSGVSGLDWFFLFLWVPAQILSTFFGIRFIKLPGNTFFWVFFVCSIISVMLTVYFVTITSTVLFLEYVMSIITVIVQACIDILTIAAAFTKYQSTKIHNE